MPLSFTCVEEIISLRSIREAQRVHALSVLALVAYLVLVVGQESFSKPTRLAHHKYGVKAAEEHANKADYTPVATNVTYLCVNTLYYLLSSVIASVNITANFLPSESTRSPIVSKNETISTIAGLVYSFWLYSLPQRQKRFALH